MNKTSRLIRDVTVAPATSAQWQVLLDGKPAATPAGHLLVLPARGLAERIADEWRGEGNETRPTTMQFTRLANTAIDRGTLGSTVIGEGTKIDNLVHIAHNVVIGRHCLIMGQVGFAGSTTLGDYTVVASQSGIADHLKIVNQVVIGAKSGVMRDLPDGSRVLGIPALPDRQTKRQIIATQQLPRLIKRLREIEKQIEELTAACRK